MAIGTCSVNELHSLCVVEVAMRREFLVEHLSGYLLGNDAVARDLDSH